MKATIPSSGGDENGSAGDEGTLQAKMAERVLGLGFEASVLTDRSGLITWNSASIEQVLGFPAEELVGKSFVALTHPEERRDFQSCFGGLFQQSQASNRIELRLNHRHLGWRWFDLRIRQCLDDPLLSGVLLSFYDISEHKLSRELYGQSEDRFRLLFEASPLGVCITRQEMLLYANRAYARLFGHHEPAELLDSSFLNQIAPDHREEMRQRIQRRHRGEFVPVSYETMGIRQNNTTFPFHVDVARIHLPDGPATVAFISNTTERRQAEELLRLLESAIQQARESIVITSADIDPPGPKILFVNEGFTRITGYWPEDVLGRSPRLMQGPKTDRAVLDRLRQSLVNGQYFHGEIYNYRKDGSEFIVELQIAPVRNRQGQITHFISTQSDITQRKRADAENQRLATFVRRNPNPVLEFSSDGALIYFNDAASDLARTLGESHPREILPPDTVDIIHGCMATGSNRLRVETAVGDRSISWSFFPITSSQVVHCYAADLTERMNLEAQLRHSQKMESVGQLAAGVAHDFNNILTVIQGFAGLLLSNCTDGKVLEPLNQIAAAAERAANLTRQLLTFSRKQVIQPRLLDLNEVINNMTKMLRRVLGEDVALQCNYHAGLPLIFADAGMIDQIVMNLAVNARDAMPNGGLLTLTTSIVNVDDAYRANNPEARQGKFVCLSVSDNGHGMDKTTLGRIFEPFFTTKEVGKGTGLGLATVYGIVKQHEGWVEASSRIDEGTTFNILLPLSERGVTSNHALTPSEVTGGRESILLVEDEMALRDLARRVLTGFGYRVFEASHGKEALDLWENHRGEVDLLFTDMVMPGGINGGELARTLQSQKPNLKVIYTSGYSVDILKRTLMFKENINFLQKPYTPTILAESVRKVLDCEAN